MATLNELDASDAIQGCKSLLQRSGLTVRQVSNPSRAARENANIFKATSGEATTNPWLDPNTNQMSSATSFWLFLYDQRGDLVGKTACRFDDLGEENFAEYQERMLKGLYREGNGNPDPDRFSAPTYEIRGRVLYFGDTYLAAAYRGLDAPKYLISLKYLIIDQKFPIVDWGICYLRPWQCQEWEWCRRYWQWEHGTAGFSSSAGSEFRGYQMGILDRIGLQNEVKAAQKLSLPSMRDTDSQFEHSAHHDLSFELGI